MTEWVIRKDTELSTLGHSPVRGDAASLQKQLVSDFIGDVNNNFLIKCCYENWATRFSYKQ